jgi:hypothetical protein
MKHNDFATTMMMPMNMRSMMCRDMFFIMENRQCNLCL